MTVDDGPKVRIVQSVSLEDRIVLNAVMNVVDRHLKVRFIRTTSASIKNRGTHDLLQYIVKDIKDDPEGTLFGYQFDITKFYESVDQDVLLDAVKKMFKDKILIGILEECIRMMPKGVSIGLRSSQGLCNLLLSIYLDHRLKDQEAVAHYYRYCDDGLVLSGSKKYLWKVRDIIHEQARKARLEIKSNDTVFPITEGIDFLGYVTQSTEKTVENPIDFAKLQKQNDEIYAYIKIDDTKVDCPIVQSGSDDAFYLRHKAEDKSWSASGAIYTEVANSKDFDDFVTVIYGHNGYSDTFFTTLHYFEKKEFFNSHPYFYIYTPKRKLTYQVISAFKYDNRHILNSFDFNKEASIKEWQDTITNPTSSLKNVRKNLDVPLSINSKIVVLSTCITNQRNNRYLVCGELVKDEKTN